MKDQTLMVTVPAWMLHDLAALAGATPCLMETLFRNRLSMRRIGFCGSLGTSTDTTPRDLTIQKCPDIIL